MKKVFLTVLVVAFVCVFAVMLSAQPPSSEKIVLVFTGETHAALFPCDCTPHIGGLSRRATAIKDLRSKNADLLLVDSGAMFGGGMFDPASQDQNMALKKTEYNLQAASMLGYDAIAIGDEELAFGADYLANIIKNTGLPFISANLELEGVKPYVLKKVGNATAGIIGLTPIIEGIPDAKISDPFEAAKKYVAELKQKGAGLIIVLSQLGEDKDEELAQKVQGIDFIVSGNMLARKEATKAIGSTTLLQPFFECRKLRWVTIDTAGNKVKGSTFTELQLDDKVANDLAMDLMLPACIVDSDCKTEGFVGECQKLSNQGTECVYRKIVPVKLTIIVPKDCVTCNTAMPTMMVRSAFPQLEVETVEYGSPEGQELAKKYEITDLPAYLLSKDAAMCGTFNKVAQQLVEKDGHFIVSPASVGMSYFAGRERKPGHIDLILNIYSPESGPMAKLVKEVAEKNKGKLTYNAYFFTPLLPQQQPQGGMGMMGMGMMGMQPQQPVVDPIKNEETIRLLAIVKDYPDKWWDYALCRTQNPETTWWTDCANTAGLDLAKVKQTASSKEMQDMLKANNDFMASLKNPPVSLILVDNQEIFGISPQTTAQEIEDIIFKKKVKQ